MKKNIFMPLMVALLLASSCSKDDDNNFVSIAEMVSDTAAQKQQKIVTIPFSIKVSNTKTLNKEMCLNQTIFHPSDVGKYSLKLSNDDKTYGISGSLELKNDDGLYYFEGDINCYEEFQAQLLDGSIKIKGLYMNGYDIDFPTSYVSLAHLMQKYCHKYITEFSYSDETISFTTYYAFLEVDYRRSDYFDLEQPISKVSGNFFTYISVIGGKSNVWRGLKTKVWVAVNPNLPWVSIELNIRKEADELEPGTVYHISRPFVEKEFFVDDHYHNKRVVFSPGNLQKQLTNPSKNYYYTFASHQYDIVGADNDKYNITNYVGVTDLLSLNDFHYHMRGSPYEWFKYVYGKGNENSWTLLSPSEWEQLFELNPSWNATVNGVNGIVVLPIEFNLELDFDKYNITADNWAKMEAEGAVFLPAAGIRRNVDGKCVVDDVGSRSYYWAVDKVSEYNPDRDEWNISYSGNELRYPNINSCFINYFDDYYDVGMVVRMVRFVVH